VKQNKSRVDQGKKRIQGPSRQLKLAGNFSFSDITACFRKGYRDFKNTLKEKSVSISGISGQKRKKTVAFSGPKSSNIAQVIRGCLCPLGLSSG